MHCKCQIRYIKQFITDLNIMQLDYYILKLEIVQICNGLVSSVMSHKKTFINFEIICL